MNDSGRYKYDPMEYAMGTHYSERNDNRNEADPVVSLSERLQSIRENVDQAVETIRKESQKVVDFFQDLFGTENAPARSNEKLTSTKVLSIVPSELIDSLPESRLNNSAFWDRADITESAAGRTYVARWQNRKDVSSESYVNSFKESAGTQDPQRLMESIAEELPMVLKTSCAEACRAQVNLERALLSGASEAEVRDLIDRRNSMLELPWLMNGKYQQHWEKDGAQIYISEMTNLKSDLLQALDSAKDDNIRRKINEQLIKIDTKISSVETNGVPIGSLYNYERYRGSTELVSYVLFDKNSIDELDISISEYSTFKEFQVEEGLDMSEPFSERLYTVATILEKNPDSVPAAVMNVLKKYGKNISLPHTYSAWSRENKIL